MADHQHPHRVASAGSSAPASSSSARWAWATWSQVGAPRSAMLARRLADGRAVGAGRLGHGQHGAGRRRGVAGRVEPALPAGQHAADARDVRADDRRAGGQGQVQDAALGRPPVPQQQHVGAARLGHQLLDGQVAQVGRDGAVGQRRHQPPHAAPRRPPGRPPSGAGRGRPRARRRRRRPPCRSPCRGAGCPGGRPARRGRRPRTGRGRRRRSAGRCRAPRRRRARGGRRARAPPRRRRRPG